MITTKVISGLVETVDLMNDAGVETDSVKVAVSLLAALQGALIVAGEHLADLDNAEFTEFLEAMAEKGIMPALPYLRSTDFKKASKEIREEYKEKVAEIDESDAVH